MTNDTTASGREVEASPYPALDALAGDQEAALETFVAGFPSRAALLKWLPTLCSVTLGLVPDTTYRALTTRATTLGALVHGERSHYLTDPAALDSEQLAAARRRLRRKHFAPVLDPAQRKLRASATEYLDDERPDPNRAGALALRPGLEALRDRQRDALASWLAGFDDVAAVDEWATVELRRATRGELDSVRPEWLHDLLASPTGRRVTLGDAPRYRREREHLAGWYLLPACNRAVRDLVDKAGESPAEEPTTDHSPEPYE